MATFDLRAGAWAACRKSYAVLQVLSPPVEITAPIVPVLSPMTWASEVFANWGRSPDLDQTVKKAIGRTAKRSEH